MVKISIQVLFVLDLGYESIAIIGLGNRIQPEFILEHEEVFIDAAQSITTILKRINCSSIERSLNLQYSC